MGLLGCNPIVSRGASVHHEKRQRTGHKYLTMKKIFAIHRTDKRLVSRIYKELLQINKKSSNNTNNQAFPEEKIQKANKHMKRCSTALVIRDTPNKTK